jgi:membrane protein DedA with SNARE-associated domain
VFAFEITQSIGLPLIFVLVMCETAGVLPMSPGEIAAISGGIEAADHKLQLLWVIVVAASGAIVGDNIGYVIGRVGGRRVLERRGPFARQRRRALEVAEPFFERHGAKAVFYGRWLPVLRVFASWFAGGAKMRWRAFVVWNALGGITWAFSMVLLGYYVGATAKSILSQVGGIGIIGMALAVAAVVIIRRRRSRPRVPNVRGQVAVAGQIVAAPAQASDSAPLADETR